MPHIGVERLGTGNTQDHGTQRKKSEQRITQQKIETIKRVDRSQHSRVLHDTDPAQQGQNSEPK